MTNPDLFHITTKWKAKNILKHGMMTGFPSSEEQGSLKEWLGRKGYDEITPEILDEYHEDISNSMGHEMNAEEWARQKLNELLPDHSHSLFFWTTEDKANKMASTLENRNYSSTKYVVLGIDSDKLEGEPYIANFDLSDEIFSELESIYKDNPPYEERQKRMEEIYEMVEEYKESTEPYDEHEDSNLEVIYTGSVPREAIVTLNGEDISIDKEQSQLSQFSKGRGWWNDPASHALASQGIKTRFDN